MDKIIAVCQYDQNTKWISSRVYWFPLSHQSPLILAFWSFWRNWPFLECKKHFSSQGSILLDNRQPSLSSAIKHQTNACWLWWSLVAQCCGFGRAELLLRQNSFFPFLGKLFFVNDWQEKDTEQTKHSVMISVNTVLIMFASNARQHIINLSNWAWLADTCFCYAGGSLIQQHHDLLFDKPRFEFWQDRLQRNTEKTLKSMPDRLLWWSFFPEDKGQKWITPK